MWKAVPRCSLVATRWNGCSLERVLGCDGMARVYGAYDRRLDRQVAVKVVPVAVTEAAERDRFTREARSAAGLRHPNSVTVFDAGEADGLLYIVMELVEGHTLADELAEGGPFESAEAIAIAVSMLAALGHAHAVGIIHRDVKPSNIMMSPDGNIKLLDFGIARRLGDLGDAVTAVGEIVGTPKYLAPEQIEGGRRPLRPICMRSASCCSRCSPATRRSVATVPSPLRLPTRARTCLTCARCVRTFRRRWRRRFDRRWPKIRYSDSPMQTQCRLH